MHMADALISPLVGGVMMAVSAGVIGYSVKKVKEELDDKKVPLMGVMGAFVFAGQMVNFTIPATGSSGHIGGGILLAALLGPYAAFLVISTVLLIQALVFADGGLLALGCNIFNMGFFSCFIAYPLIYKLINNKPSPKRITVGSIIAVVVGLQFGSLFVVAETLLSGVTKLPFGSFVLLMQPIHLAIGLVEGIATAAVLCFVFQTDSSLLDVTGRVNYGAASRKKVIAILLISALILGGGVSLWASSYPDGLEWSIQGVSGAIESKAESAAYQVASSIQEFTAILPDYSLKDTTEAKTTVAKTTVAKTTVGTATSGMVGSFVTLSFTCLVGYLISLSKKRRKNTKVLEEINVKIN